MTNKELKAIVNQHMNWVDSYGTKGKQADLSHKNLMRLDFTNVNLPKAKLNNVSMAHNKMSGIELEESNLSEADLVGADLSKANLISANLQGADLTNANLEGAILYRTDLTNAILKGANLTNTYLYNCIGNGKEVISHKFPKHNITYTHKILFIDGISNTISGWKTVPEISLIPIDIQWWKKWKSTIFQLIKENPATPPNQPPNKTKV